MVFEFQLQVIEDDKRNRSGVFSTAVKGAVPPLVTTPFITQDQGRYKHCFLMQHDLT